ncbi:MAG: TetR/AcrR family transcriptional regulator [Agriterribacter sp.]
MANEKFREKVLDAAQKLFREKGLGVVSMEDVAKGVGKGKSTLYYYFKSKEEIFNAVLDAEMNSVILESIRQVSLKKGVLNQLMAFANTKFEMTRKRRSLFKAMEVGLDAEALSDYEEVKRRVHHKYVQKEKQVLQQLLVSAIEHGEIRKMSNAKLDETIFIFLSSLRGINREFFVHGSSEDGTQMIVAICQLFYDGLK